MSNAKAEYWKSMKFVIVFTLVVSVIFFYLFVISLFVLNGSSTITENKLKKIDLSNIPSVVDHGKDVKYRPDVSSALRHGIRSSSVDTSKFSAGKGYRLTRKLPEVLIIGVKKGGTRALLEFLRLHPDIRASGRETHFFDKNYYKGFKWYRRMMPLTVEGQLTMEKTPSYFVTESVPSRVRSMSRNVRLLLVVRDPVTRIISDYTQFLSKSSTSKSLKELAFRNFTSGSLNRSWRPLRIGIYCRHLSRWRRYFPKRNFHFVNGENLVKDPAHELSDVENFLGLTNVISDDHFFYNETKGFPCLKKWRGGNRPHCLGKSKGRTHPPIDDAVIDKLRQFYRPFNRKFYRMTGIDFRWP